MPPSFGDESLQGEGQRARNTSASHLRRAVGRHLRPHRAGLHHGLRHHQPDQFRPRRPGHDRGLRGLLRRGTPGGEFPPGHLPGHAHSRLPERGHRAPRLPAAAEQTAPFGPHHRHRRVHLSREFSPHAALHRSQLPAVSHAHPLQELHSSHGSGAELHSDREHSRLRRPYGGTYLHRAPHQSRTGDAGRFLQ